MHTLRILYTPRRYIYELYTFRYLTILPFTAVLRSIVYLGMLNQIKKKNSQS